MLKQKIEVFPGLEMSRLALFALCLTGFGGMALGAIGFIHAVLGIPAKS